MLLPDVNVLIYAHREDSTSDHPHYAEWLTQLATGPQPFALSVLTLSGLVRIATIGSVGVTFLTDLLRLLREFFLIGSLPRTPLCP